MTNEFDEYINRLGTFCTQWDYIEDRFGDKNLLPFSVSDTDFKVPIEIMSALEQRLLHPVFGYTRWNHDEFKQPVIDWFAKRFKATIKSNWIVYSPSVIYSVSRLIELNSSSGDGVLINTPAYDAFFKTIRANGRTLVTNPLNLINGKYEIDFDLLEKQLAEPSTKIYLLCSPHNPTGRVWTKSELEKIVEVCQKYNVFLISDEIHMDIVRKENHHTPITEITQNNVALCTSASKTFNIPGLIFSYIILPDDKQKTSFINILKERDGLSSTSILGMHGTIAAYTECSYWVDDLNDYIEENTAFVEDFLENHLPDLKVIQREATYLLWISTKDSGFNSESIQKALIEHGKVAVMPGNTYGIEGEDFIRLNVGCSREKLKDGLNRILTAFTILYKSK